MSYIAYCPHCSNLKSFKEKQYLQERALTCWHNFSHFLHAVGPMTWEVKFCAIHPILKSKRHNKWKQNRQYPYLRVDKFYKDKTIILVRKHEAVRHSLFLFLFFISFFKSVHFPVASVKGCGLCQRKFSELFSQIFQLFVRIPIRESPLNVGKIL